MSRAYSESLVLRVNELFYDLVDDQYTDVHTEMARSEHDRWRTTFNRFRDSSRPVAVADLGSGAGLVGCTIGDLLGIDDSLMCADLSARMLETARTSLTSIGLKAHLDFRKIERAIPLRLPFDTESIDIVTMNSVLHHIEDTQGVLDEINRVLKPDGLFILGHEPNRLFRQSFFLRVNYRILSALLMHRHTIKKSLRIPGVYRILERVYYAFHPAKKALAEERSRVINDTLRAEGLTTRELTLEEIAGITDIRDSEGFDPQDLGNGLELVWSETYNYMLLISIKHGARGWIRRYENYLHRKFPNRGATFFAVYRKSVPISLSRI